MGSALNSSDLSPRLDAFSPLDLVTAMAYSQTNPNAEEHVAHPTAAIDPRAHLGSMLVRLKYAGDNSTAARVESMLEHWVRHQKAFRRWDAKSHRDGLVKRFIRQGLDEWLFPICQECHGRELVGLDRGEIKEQRIRCTRCSSKGWLHEHSRGGVKIARNCGACAGKGWRTHLRIRKRETRLCWKCNGTGLRIAGETERALALGIELRVYQRHWARRFTWLAEVLDRVDHAVKRSLQSQLRAGITRA